MKALEREAADLLIIGAGLTGMAAAVFAAARGIRTTVAGWTRGGLSFASGTIDILGVYPTGERKRWEDPWAAISTLSDETPDHPYARLGADRIRLAMDEFLAIVAGAGLPYRTRPGRNVLLPTAAGTLKITHGVPETMWAGVDALEKRARTLIVGFEGMKEFSSTLVAEILKARLPQISHATVAFPFAFMGRDRHNLLLAETLDSTEVRARVADAVRPLVRGFDSVGFPAILGIGNSRLVTADLEEQTGASIFEIPTMPPSVPGQRLMNSLELVMVRQGVDFRLSRRALRVEPSGDRLIVTLAGKEGQEEVIDAGGVLLATGRFLGRGLAADSNGLRETLFGLPVHQPESREGWHRELFFHPEGHPVNRAGLIVDNDFRPLGGSGECAFQNLFAAGSILAHQDWVREKSGAGLAIATAWGAVEAFRRMQDARSAGP